MFLSTVLKRFGVVPFDIQYQSIELKNEFWFPKMSGGTIATSLLRCTRDVLKLSFHMFHYIEILKFPKVKSDLIFKINNQEYI